MTYHVRVYSTDGKLLVQTWNKGENSRDMEINAALSRNDVSRVEWWGDGSRYTSDGKPDLFPLTTVYYTSQAAEERK